MPVDPELLEILACPNARRRWSSSRTERRSSARQCKRVYPIKDDIPVMLLDEATIEP